MIRAARDGRSGAAETSSRSIILRPDLAAGLALLVGLALVPELGLGAHATATFDGVAQVGLALAAFACCYARRSRNNRVAWTLLSAAALTLAFGEIVFMTVDAGSTITGATRSVLAADVAFVVTMVLVVSGASVLGLHGAGVGLRRLLAEGMLVLTSLWSLTWELALQYVAPPGAAMNAHTWGLVLAPFVDLVALASVIVGIVHHRRNELKVLALAISLMVTVDIMWALGRSGRFDVSRHLASVVLVDALVLLCVAARTPPPADGTDVVPGFAARSMLVYGPLCAVIVTVIVEIAFHVPNTAMSMYLVAAIGIAIVVNQVSTYVENQRLHASLEERLRELSEREERHRVTVDEMGDAVVVIDASGQLREVTSRWTEMLGWSADESIGKSFATFAHPDELAQLRDVFAEAIVSSRLAALTTRGLCADGSYRWLEVEITNLMHVPLIEGLLCIVRDVEDRMSAAGRLRRAEERFRVAFAAAPIGMTVTSEGVLLEVNEAFASMLGYSSAELVGVPIADLTVPHDHRLIMAGLAQVGSGEKATHSGEQRYLHRSGRIVLGSVSLSMVHDRDDGALVIGQIEDITERREIEERMHWAARHDEVTGLYNRAYFMERLGESLAILTDGFRLAVVFLDLDRFKVVNDSLGHGSGDDLLRVVARRLLATMRASDIVARFGGDEFTILLDPAPSEEQVLLLAERVADELAKPIPLATGDVYVTASLGVAFADRAGLSGEHLIRDADAAMYRAKERGRNRIERFDEETHASVVRNLRTGNDLHRALERHEFEVHYQPVWTIRDQHVVGMEALVRWRHPERGLVLPGDFIGLAEDTGLIVPIGAQVLETALQQLARWQDHLDYPALTMAVNLSARQLGSPNLVETLRGALDRSSVDPGRVWLEITESALMSDVKASELTIRALRAQGVRLSVDDFGTGYSSLTYLKRFPVEGLKIDRSFVDGLGTDEEDGTIVEAVVRLGLALGLKVVAEGVENVIQLDYLATTGCGFGQGHLISRPVPAPQLELAFHSGALSLGRALRD